MGGKKAGPLCSNLKIPLQIKKQKTKQKLPPSKKCSKAFFFWITMTNELLHKYGSRQELFLNVLIWQRRSEENVTWKSVFLQCFQERGGRERKSCLLPHKAICWQLGPRASNPRWLSLLQSYILLTLSSMSLPVHSRKAFLVRGPSTFHLKFLPGSPDTVYSTSAPERRGKKNMFGIFFSSTS